jgi:very-short-patch-repair endonuclease
VARLNEGGRQRGLKVKRNVLAATLKFQNPYPWMSEIEAMVHLELERRKVPFSWRYFDGESLHLKTLMPDFTPEFTLRELRVVVLIAGNFFGTLPGILDMNALAQVLLEEDGWTVLTLFEDEIRADPSRALDQVPALINPTVQGGPRPNPYGIPDFMQKRRQQLRSQGLLRGRFALDKGSTRSGRRRIRRRLRGDSGRTRAQQDRHSRPISR